MSAYHQTITVMLQDSEVRKAFQRSLTKQGFKFMLNTKVNSAEIKADKVTLELETKKGDKNTLDADVVLVCAGLHFLLFISPFMHALSHSSILLPPTHHSHTLWSKVIKYQDVKSIGINIGVCLLLLTMHDEY